MQSRKISLSNGHDLQSVMCISKLMSFSCMAGLERDETQCIALIYEFGKAGI